MNKYDLYGDGTVIEVTERDFLNLLTQFTNNCYSLAKSYIVNHASGLADFNHSYFKENLGRLKKQNLTASEGIDDYLLREKMDGLIGLLEKLHEADEKMIEAYTDAIFVDELNNNHENDLKNLVYNYLYQKHKSPPVSVVELANDTYKYIAELENLREKIVLRIEQLLTLEK